MTSYNKFEANKNAEFRNAIAETGGDFEIVKKRIFLKACADAGVELTKEDLDGHLAIVFAKDDPINTTKALYKFRKENKDLIEVLGGHFDGKLVTKDEVEQLSQLPSMDEMRAQFVGLLQAPMSQTLGVMHSLMTSVMHCLDQKAKKEDNN